MTTAKVPQDAEELGEITTTLQSISVRYDAGPAFRRYKSILPITLLVTTAALASTSGIIFPLLLQQLEFAKIFVGPDATANLQHLTNLKAAIDAGSATATPSQAHQLALLAKFDSSRASALSLGLALSALLTMIVQPLTGALSDRTRSRWGRRAPWIAGGAVFGTAALVAFNYAPTVGVLLGVYALAQLAISVMQAPVNASIADRVPEKKLGLLSALSGLGFFLGSAVGALLAGQLFPVFGGAAAVPFAGLLLIASVLFIVLAPDKSSKELQPPRTNAWKFVGSLVSSLRDRDFAFVWVARALLLLGYAVAATFSLYMLQSYIQPALSATEAAQIAPLLSVASLPVTLIAMFVGGRLSDRWKRRKPFVVFASIGMAVSLLVPAFWPSLTAMFIQTILGAAAFGVYYAVDVALFVDVLPDKTAAGRDLGMSNMSTTLGMTLGPLLAGQVVAITGQYQLVWIVAAIVVVLAAVFVIPVRRVR